MLAYDQPIARSEPDGASSPAPQGRFDLLQLGRIVWRRRIMIASSALICALIAVAAGKSLTPRFTATAELYVDPRELQLVDRELTPRAQDVSGLAMVVESQARLMTSSSVLLQVIKDQQLDADPEFGGSAKGPLARLLGLVGFELHTAADTTVAATAALEALNRHITIRKTERIQDHAADMYVLLQLNLEARGARFAALNDGDTDLLLLTSRLHPDEVSRESVQTMVHDAMGLSRTLDELVGSNSAETG